MRMSWAARSEASLPPRGRVASLEIPGPRPNCAIRSEAGRSPVNLHVAPGPFHIFKTKPTSALLLASPLTIIPTFAVPIYVLLHLISVRYLVASRSAAQLSRSVKLEASA